MDDAVHTNKTTSDEVETLIKKMRAKKKQIAIGRDIIVTIITVALISFVLDRISCSNECKMGSLTSIILICISPFCLIVGLAIFISGIVIYGKQKDNCKKIMPKWQDDDIEQMLNMDSDKVSTSHLRLLADLMFIASLLTLVIGVGIFGITKPTPFIITLVLMAVSLLFKVIEKSKTKKK